MKLLYLDCFSGISGDMCLGALVGAGASVPALKKELAGLPLAGYAIKESKVLRGGIEATKIDVVLKGPEPARRWKDIESIIGSSKLKPEIQKHGLKIFRRLFEAEAKVHGSAYDKVHLHELGATDALVDIMGSLICLDLLGVERVCASAVNLGSGTVLAAHGKLPVPAPATAELIKGIAAYASDIPFELTTPTGAALIAGLCDSFGPMPLMAIESVGMGAGGRDFPDRPNVLRAFIGKSAGGMEEVSVIETDIDDMNPQVYEYAMQRLFALGALDVTLTQLIMKKGRPGVKLSVLCKSADRDKLIETLFMETTTIGVRHYPVQRTVLDREIIRTPTAYGALGVKVSKLRGRTVRITPEYEDCKEAARKTGAPLLDIIASSSSSSFLARTSHRRPTKGKPKP